MEPPRYVLPDSYLLSFVRGSLPLVLTAFSRLWPDFITPTSNDPPIGYIPCNGASPNPIWQGSRRGLVLQFTTCLVIGKAAEFPKNIKKRCSLYSFIFLENIHTRICHIHQPPPHTLSLYARYPPKLIASILKPSGPAHTYLLLSKPHYTPHNRVHPLHQQQPCQNPHLHSRLPL